MGKQKELWEERYKVVVSPCEWFESPREYNERTTMVCFHKRYNLGDEHDYKEKDFSSWDELKKRIMKEHKVSCIKPLYMYEHSGITISTKPFSCHWDSGQIGWVFTTRGDGWKRVSKKRHAYLSLLIEADVNTYDSYLRGDAYKYEIVDLKADPAGDTIVATEYEFLSEEEALREGESMADVLFVRGN